jgi:hypothetical protein
VWPTEVSAEVRRLASALYLHITSIPESSTLDPKLLQDNWVKVDLGEVAKELALTGVVANEQGYGNFGGNGDGLSFMTLLKKHAPISSLSELPDEGQGGNSVHHIGFRLDKKRTLDLILELHRVYFAKELQMNDNQLLRFSDAIENVEGEAWVNKGADTLDRIVMRVTLDDDIILTHAKGTIEFDISLSEFNTPTKVAIPDPVITLEELRVLMETTGEEREKIIRDKKKIQDLKLIMSTLSTYREQKGRYPTILTELYDSGVLASSTISSKVLSAYEYVPYTSGTVMSGQNRCVKTSTSCGYYHIGINLEDMSSELLKEDYDKGSSYLRGADTRGCLNENRLACYDLVSHEVSNGVTESKATTTNSK